MKIIVYSLGVAMYWLSGFADVGSESDLRHLTSPTWAKNKWWARRVPFFSRSTSLLWLSVVVFAQALKIDLGTYSWPQRSGLSLTVGPYYCTHSFNLSAMHHTWIFFFDPGFNLFSTFLNFYEKSCDWQIEYHSNQFGRWCDLWHYCQNFEFGI